MIQNSRVRALVLGLGALMVCGAAAAQSAPASAPTTAPAASLTSPAEHALTSSVRLASAGKFDKAAGELTQALADDPGDLRAKQALTLIENYSKRMDEALRQRQQEYQAAVDRVERAMLAQKHMAQQADDKAVASLRTALRQVSEAFGKVATAEALETADQDKAAKLKADAVEAITDAGAKLATASKLSQDASDEYSRKLAELEAQLDRQLHLYKQAWEAVKIDGIKTRLDSAEALRGPELDVADAMADVEAMVSTKPWRVALVHGRIAKDLAGAQSPVTQQQWYKQLREMAENLGQAAVKDARWYDALYAYSGLVELEPANQDFKRQDKVIRRHVRVLGLYGRQGPGDDDLAAADGEEDPENPQPKRPTTTQAADNIIKWQDMVEGVDGDMIRSAISQMSEFYVTPVDYRKVAQGALTAVRVLAETPQASRSFEGLADKQKLAQFIEAIERQSKAIADRDRVDHLDIQLGLNSMLRASERTVGIPAGVIAMEYAEGMLEELDRFSSMVWPNDVDDFTKQTMGNFSGIGIQISKEPGEPLKVVSPLPGSPAYKAGIKTNDLIVEVDGTPTESVQLDKLVRMITGEKGTYVQLKVKRQGVVQPIDMSVVRDEITIQTVKGWRMLDEGKYSFMLDGESGIGYIRLTQFTDQTAKDLDEALAQLKKQGLKSLILDLRFNPGGLLRSARDVADEFLDHGTVVSTRGRQTPEQKLSASINGKYLEGDLVVLVNRFSASAAEIVSGALKDWDRAIVLGERSFGKGSVQNVIPIRRHQAFLKLTTAYYYLPSGRLLHRKENGDSEENYGVGPDVEVLLTPRQMARWLDIRRKTDLLQETDPDDQQETLAKQYDADLQLQTAVVLLKLRQIEPQAVSSAKAQSDLVEWLQR